MRLSFLGDYKYFWRPLQKRSYKTLCEKSAPLNKQPAKGTTLKTDANVDVLDLIIIRACLEECSSEPTFYSRINKCHSLHT